MPLTKTADDIFQDLFKGNPANMVTPVVITRGLTKKYAWEISKGELKSGVIYAVTVLDRNLLKLTNKGSVVRDIEKAFQVVNGLD